MKQIVKRAGWTILGLHMVQIVAMGPTRTGGAMADSLEIAAAGLAMIACWHAAMRSGGRYRPFWMLFGAAMAAQLAADVTWSWLQDVRGIEEAATVVWMRNMPLLRTLLLTVLVMRDPDSRRLGLPEWLDVIQVAIVYALSFLLVDYNTASSPDAEGLWLQFLPRCLILLIAIFRVARWRGRAAAGLEKGLLAYLAFYLFAEGAAAYRLATAGLPTGTWVDLAWTVSPVAVSWWATSWKPAKEPDENRSKYLADLFLANASFVLMPLVAVLQAAQLRETFQMPRYYLLGTSFLCFAARLGVSEFRQSRQLASLVTQDRKLRETHHELEVQTKLLEELFASAPEAVAVLDDDRRVLRVNAEFTRLFGYRHDEVEGRTLDELVSPAIPVAEDRRGDVTSASLDTTCRNKAGEEIEVSVLDSQILLPEGQRVTYWICRDIREKKRAEERLLQSQKMEAIGRLAGGVAHDFNNLLTVINGYSDLILRVMPKDDRFRERISTIRKAGGQAAGLTQQLLAFSRKQIVQPQVVNPNALILESEAMYRRLLGEDVHLTVQCEASGSIVADPGQLNQILINLLVNARDAMPRGGTIQIRVTDQAELAHPSVGGGEPGSLVVLSVKDTGTGIDSAVRPHIFEPFFTTKKTGEGTGLGLATVYGILQQMGASINFESEPDRGTTFEVCFAALPRTEEASEAGPAEPEKPSKGARILLVEDQDNVRAFIRDVLTEAGYSVVPCAGAQEGFAAAAENGTKIDLLVTDVVLPDLDGPELASRLKADHPHLKVLFVSGYPGSFLERRGVKDLESSLLMKPVAPEALLAGVQRILEG